MALTKVRYAIVDGPIVNASDFGADPSLADNQSAIQAAIDAVPATGGTLIIPAGDYILKSAITLRSNIKITGVGNQNSKLIFDMNLDSACSVSELDNIAIENIRLWGDTVAGNPDVATTANGFSFAGCTNLHFENVEFNTFTVSCLALSRVNNAWIQGGDYNSTASVEANLNNATTNAVVKNCQFRNANSSAGYRSFGGRNIIIDGCLFENNALRDVFVDDASTNYEPNRFALSDNIVVTNCIGDGICTFTGLYSGGVYNSKFSYVEYRSYDFDQQNVSAFVSAPEYTGLPFFHQNYGPKRSFVIEGNILNKCVVRSGGGHCRVNNNTLISNESNDELLVVGNNGVVWQGSTTYWDSTSVTSIDNQPTNCNGNTFVAAHSGTTGAAYLALQPKTGVTLYNSVLFSTRSGSWTKYIDATSQWKYSYVEPNNKHFETGQVYQALTNTNYGPVQLTQSNNLAGFWTNYDVDQSTAYDGTLYTSAVLGDTNNSRIRFLLGPTVGDAPVNYYEATGSAFIPSTTNVRSLGAAGNLWTEVFATNGTINTSDEREKQQIRDLTVAEKTVAANLKSLIKAFKFNHAVEAKGEAARTHIGVIAQEVKAAFEAEGLNGFDYGILCYDEWDAVEALLDEDGNELEPAKAAGNSYGVRYDELFAFIISAL